jgi:hypothetical protein
MEISKMDEVRSEEWVRRWWPLPTSLDLVRGPVERVANAVKAEIHRFEQGQEVSSGWVPFANLDDIFASVDVFTNFPTVFFVIPTVSAWSVLWNNSFLCDGYDSLCHCPTLHHGLITLHWQASDSDGPFTAGSLFNYRKPSEGGMSVRSVYCSREGRRWKWHETGVPLPQEDVHHYSSVPKSKRLNERVLLTFLAELGARPREQSFYQPGRAFRIARARHLDRCNRKSFMELQSLIS